MAEAVQVSPSELIEMSVDDRHRTLKGMSDQELRFIIKSLMFDNQNIRIVARIDALSILALRGGPC